jgi:hypothetical protein
VRMHSIYCHLVMNLTQYLAQHSINSKGRLFRHQTTSMICAIVTSGNFFRNSVMSPISRSEMRARDVHHLFRKMDETLVKDLFSHSVTLSPSSVLPLDHRPAPVAQLDCLDLRLDLRSRHVVYLRTTHRGYPPQNQGDLFQTPPSIPQTRCPDSQAGFLPD